MAFVKAASGHRVVDLDFGVTVTPHSAVNVDLTQPIAAAALAAGTIIQIDSTPAPETGLQINNQRATFLVTPTAPGENAIVVKDPSSAWGDESVQPYGHGQAFMVLRADDPAAVNVPDDLVVFRINRDGGFGSSGGAHIAPGTHMRPGASPTQAVWIQNLIDTIGQIITLPDGGTKEWLICATPTKTVFKIRPDGRAEYMNASCRVYRDAALALVTGQATAIPWNQERFDPAGMHSTGPTAGTAPFPERLVAQYDGLYECVAYLEFAGAAAPAGLRQGFIYSLHTNQTEAADLRSATPGNGVVTQMNLTTGTIKLAAGEYCIVNCMQSQGAALNLTTNSRASLTYQGKDV